MFPIPWNKAFRKKDGTVVNIADAMSGGGGGSDLPEHSIADAGKVLTVADDGSLEWDEAGAGGGEVIVDDVATYGQGSGSHTYTKTVEITEGGNYCIFTGFFCSSVIVKINDVTQDNYVDNSGSYIHFYRAVELALNAGDVLDFQMSSSGATVFNNSVIKL